MSKDGRSSWLYGLSPTQRARADEILAPYRAFQHGQGSGTGEGAMSLFSLVRTPSIANPPREAFIRLRDLDGRIIRDWDLGQ